MAQKILRTFLRGKMNDRFKFRLWDDEKKQYHHNDFVVTATGYINKILEQCTGLKDKNDNLIYEGDIIRVEDNNCSVSWDNENARYEVSGYGEIAYLNYYDIEVIGNVHENYDLLGDKEQ